MKATQQLVEEHQAVKIMLKVLDRICSNTEQGIEPTLVDMDSIIAFLKGFVDKCHHGKEEDILFPELELRGVPKAGGRIGVMLKEHEQGRTFIKEMGAALELIKDNEQTNSAKSQFVDNGRLYAKLLLEHISKEEQVLFKMADSLLEDQVQDELYEKFERLELERMEPGQHEQYHHLLKHLAATYIPNEHEHHH